MMDIMDKLPTTTDTLLTPAETAPILGVSLGTLLKRRQTELAGGRKSEPPFIKENGRIYYLESEVLRVKRDGFSPAPNPYRGGRPAGHVSQRQASVLLDLPKGVLDHDHRNGRTIPVWGKRSAPFYPLDGIKGRLKGTTDRLLTFNQTVRALDTTPERLADHVTNVRAGFPTMLALPFEDTPSGAMRCVGFRLSAVIKAAEVLFQHAEE